MEVNEMASTTLSSGLQATRQVTAIATVAMVGALCFAAIVAALHVIRPDLNPISRPTSAYAVGPNSFLMTSAFFSMSLASFALVVALYQTLSPSARSRFGLGLLALWSTGVFIAMIFPMDARGAPQTLSGMIHQTAGPLTFLCLSTGMVLVSWRLKRDNNWRSLYPTALTLSWVMLAAFLATFLSFSLDLGFLGLFQRIALGTAVVWILLMASCARAAASTSVAA
jgi:hypothetical protein